MSSAAPTVRPDVAPPRRAARCRDHGSARWTRVALACLVLVGSGLVRSWQAGRVGAMLREGRVAPFPLDQVPLTLGTWRGQPVRIDPRIARHTGATDFVTRRYVDQRTGSAVDVVLLYGVAAEVSQHAPEVCYPNAGFERVEGPDRRTIAVGPLRAEFRSLVYSQGQGAQAGRREVYYAWRYGGRWTAQAGPYKRFERIPGMFKVQLDRALAEHERRDVGNPCEALLEVLLPELEHRLARAPAPTREAPR